MTPADRRFLDKSMYMEIAAEYVYSADAESRRRIPDADQ